LIDGDGQCWRGFVKHYSANHFTQDQTAADIDADGRSRGYSGCSHRQSFACELENGALHGLACGLVCLQGPDNREAFELWSGMEREASHVRLIGTKSASSSFFPIAAENADKGNWQRLTPLDGYGFLHQRGTGRLKA
jgi:hypothetical protein